MKNDWKVTLQGIRDFFACSPVSNEASLAEILCVPAFYHEMLLQVEKTRAHTVVRMITYNEKPGEADFSSPINRIEEVTTVPKNHAKSFWKSIESLHPLQLADLSTVGADGIDIEYRIQSQGRENRFHAWCPPRSSPHLELGNLILQLALKHLPDDESRSWMLEVSSYLNDW